MILCTLSHGTRCMKISECYDKHILHINHSGVGKLEILGSVASPAGTLICHKVMEWGIKCFGREIISQG